MKKTAVIWALSLASLGINVPAGRTAIVAYTFGGSIDSGALLGTGYSGAASFDNAGITGSGLESVPVTSLSFTLLSSTFTEADGNAPPTAAFFDGSFLGIDYAVTITDAFFPVSDFALTTGFDLTDAAFTYIPRSGAGGTGGLSYSPVVVPEPSSVLGLLALGGIASITPLARRGSRDRRSRSPERGRRD